MLQRVQSIYLALVFILVAAMSFFPITSFTSGDITFSMDIFRFNNVENLDIISQLPNTWPLPILAALLAVLSGVSLSRFKNRKQQLKLNSFALLVNFCLLVCIFLYSENIAKINKVYSEINFEIAAYFPIASVLMLILANRNIRKDEKLIKESDRLR